MNRNYIKPPGSALLLTLLIMVSVSSIVLGSAKAVNDSTRIVGATDSAILAEQMAQSGIEEGFNRLSQSATSATNGDYGVGAVYDAVYGNTYSLTPMRRGFKQGTKCQTIISDSTPTNSAIDQNCPYYDLTIRSMVSISNDTSKSYAAQTFDINGRDLPVGGSLTLPISQFQGGYFTIKPTYVGGASGSMACQAFNASNNPVSTLEGCPKNNIGLFIVSSLGNVRSIQLTVDKPLDSATVIYAQPSPLTIGKGFTTIDAIGYAGGVQKRLMMTVPKDPTIKRNLANITQGFDQFGILH